METQYDLLVECEELISVYLYYIDLSLIRALTWL